ncbi:hypothetical protein ACIRJM_18595 [Streptomyces sp. NPDC102405]|jgi:hypothetical protein|uniref:hypothetical protein n=1 Tax=Streptomyces sp. NPDC102405 TaxID=3366170 RepID=UPI003822D68D
MPEPSPHQSPQPQPQPSKSIPPPGDPGSGKGFADTFRRRPARAPRGLTPGSRVWAVTGWTAVTTATAVTVLMTVPPLLADRDDDKHETGQTVMAAPEPVTPSPSPSPKPSKKTASPSPSKKETKREEPAPVVVTTTVKAAPVSKKPAAKQTKKAPKAPSTPEWTQTVIAATNILSTGESWKTNRIRMVMQGDGNLVVYNENNKATWASMVFGEGHTARFQTDGNLCVYNGEDKPVWATGTFGHPGAKLVLRKDGKVVIVDGGTVLWST